MINRLPYWFRQDIPDTLTFKKVRLLSESNLNTVCQQARCPNLGACFRDSRLTFMILGDTCTRNCRFCGVNKSDDGTLSVDKDEPYRISEIVKILKLNYVVITSVTRDDLLDGGATQFARTIELIHNIDKNINPVRNTKALSEENKISNGVKIEVLIPDFQGKVSSLKTVLDAQPDLVAHNIETVRGIYKDLRPKARYNISLEVLKKIKELKPALTTKSSLMLGLGEKAGEVIKTMQDLRDNQCDILTLGQYLAPSKNHYPVKEFIDMDQFQRYQETGLNLGFKVVLSGPLVRSSYQAKEVYKTCMMSS